MFGIYGVDEILDIKCWFEEVIRDHEMRFGVKDLDRFVVNLLVDKDNGRELALPLLSRTFGDPVTTRAVRHIYIARCVQATEIDCDICFQNEGVDLVTVEGQSDGKQFEVRSYRSSDANFKKGNAALVREPLW